MQFSLNYKIIHKMPISVLLNPSFFVVEIIHFPHLLRINKMVLLNSLLPVPLWHYMFPYAKSRKNTYKKETVNAHCTRTGCNATMVLLISE